MIESGGGGDSEVQRTMLELLNQLDGFEATKNIKVIMATNRIDILDSALLRPGRIDRKIEFPPPNEEARLDILKIHSRRMNLTRGINLRKIAEQMGDSHLKVLLSNMDPSFPEGIHARLGTNALNLSTRTSAHLFSNFPQVDTPGQVHPT